MSEWLPLLAFATATGAQLVLVGVWIGRATSTLAHLARAVAGLEARLDRHLDRYHRPHHQEPPRAA